MFSQQPLAERIRPSQLEELLGQEHLVGEKGVLSRTLRMGTIPSMILWGPPGVGKTTIANIIANQAKAPFYTLSAISSGVKEVREVIDKARRQQNAILFIDEIHRFNKAQQDALLGAVEKGTVTLIGATTENPSFEVNSALLSRCQVYSLKPLNKDQLMELATRAFKDDPELGKKNLEIKESEALFNLSGGDARKLLNILELIVQATEGDDILIDNKTVIDVVQRKVALYDKKGEQHYDIISAFIKSMRGSDPNAAVYYLARMIEGGEDVKFIARRMLILASEDIGNANPTALVLANNCFQAVNVIGYPEAQIILSQCATYLACSPKSNASYKAISKARSSVQKTGDLPIPLALRNSPTQFMKDEGYGQGYKYAHDYPNNFAPIEFLPEEIRDTKFYNPGDNPREKELRDRLRALWKEKYGY